jgi:L-fucose mutarotase
VDRGWLGLHCNKWWIADANFPAASIAARTPGGLIECDGQTAIPLLKDVCKLLPLDETAPPLAVMELMPEHRAAGWQDPPVWKDFEAIASEAEGRNIAVERVERFAFYERAKKAFAVVATGETALYGNLIVKKGVLGPEDDRA